MFAFDRLCGERSWTTGQRTGSQVDFWELAPREALRLLNYSDEYLSPEIALVRSAVSDALAQMSDELSEIAWHCGVLDKRQADVARELNINQSTVSRRWKQALAELEGSLS